MEYTDTKQTDRNPNGTFAKGNTLAKDKGVDFGSKPENRHSGAWKKTDTPRYKLEKLIQLTSSEIEELIIDKNTPLFEKKLATAILDADWKVIRDIIHEVYGRPKETKEISTPEQQYPIALIEFV
jgi:hypothetical protein